MGIYNFQKRFVPMIESGAKTHTIRATRRFPEKPGKMLYLYTGLRHKGARLLKRVRCSCIQLIEILKGRRVSVDGIPLSSDECEALARSDGFKDFAEMMTFWEGRLPFYGRIIHWEDGDGR